MMFVYPDYNYIAAFLPPAVQDVMVESIKGETVMLSCTNNNPPTLATEIRWTQDDDVLQRLLLTEDSQENTVTYTTEADESGVYQCQVLSANETVLVVNVVLTVDEGKYTVAAWIATDVHVMLIFLQLMQERFEFSHGCLNSTCSYCLFYSLSINKWIILCAIAIYF